MDATTSTTTLSLRCVICNAESARSCAGCKSTAHCGKDCQKVDWRCHKPLCSKFAAGQTSTGEPALHTTRAILFPATGDEPELVRFVNWDWPALHREVDEDAINDLFDRHDDPRVLSHVEGKDRYLLALYEDTNRVRRYRRQDSILEIWHREYGGHRENRAIARATGGSMFHRWGGNVLVLAMSHPTPGRNVNCAYKDISLGDFRDAVDFLSDYLNPLREWAELVVAIGWDRRLDAEEKARRRAAGLPETDDFIAFDIYDPVLESDLSYRDTVYELL
ncbi:hypothetical protein DL766_005499 [Monosporascus sp. MC13-8B]|uniref:MYND-type domain-containing protein n=1 Tax=Monosporascus cannonballus TaxID=155416 RepID=A0ABY0H8M0_9PEZI|nr:hypothetical protein DL763_010366 [Monosporascus cannonballus]RYO87642.1 hypothetical protein DL762_004186 [Monosporascus cannonballus]RYP29212.1 hypothetical protein DL766_005499 [Monosporascus sp. MC13-8B]